MTWQWVTLILGIVGIIVAGFVILLIISGGENHGG